MTAHSETVLPRIGSAEEYARLLHELEPWRTAVLGVCRREGAPIDSPALRLGLVGTYPTVIVADRWVVKLIGPWWSGPESFAAEADAYDLLDADPSLPVPRRLAQGELVPGEWRYLVLSFIPGVPLSAVFDQLTAEARLEVARWVGGAVRQLNQLPLRPGRALQPDWEPFVRFLTEQRGRATERHRGWGSLPPHLLHQLDDWLPPIEALVDRSQPPVFVHGDLHGDHILGVVDGKRFRPTGILDFTDVQIGDAYYELGAVQRDAFRCDRSMLAAYREAAGLPDPGQLGFARRALKYLLLHDFDQLADLPWLAEVETLDELADRMFGAQPDGR